MELQQMRYVVAVAETSNFTRAAERCHVVQSALSHQVKRLEEELGVALFARTSRRVRLTPAGEAFLPAARLCLESADRAAAEAAATIGQIRGRLNVGVIPTVAAVDVPAALSRLRRRHPQVRVGLRTGASNELVADVASGELDVAFLGLPGTRRPTGVQSFELARERLVAVLPPDHPRAGRKRLRLADLAGEPAVDFPYGSAGRAQTDEAFAQAGLARDVAFEVTDVALMSGLIRAGLAIGFLAAPYVEIAPELKGLVAVTVTDAPHRTEYVVWPSPGPTPATAEFLTAVGVSRTIH
ncbi:LysR substrate-binding domain-containing protein [Nocardioides sp.]|uniref:LysR substrate-binding domain-containing protein n=1 Tax=Nocardioides sp. TaxID=35761 RepID=UPI002736D520|nr:LysR substrate-binding domain-containing protein [Nocardioides sp.]MDP3892053.1 LysR substrate-binding domain-containing protein [Nocardioides sp.]